MINFGLVDDRQIFVRKHNRSRTGIRQSDLLFLILHSSFILALNLSNSASSS